MVSATEAALVPIPIADEALLSAIEISMMLRISAVYGVNISQNRIKSLVGTMLGALGASYAGSRIAGSLAKFILGAGSVVGTVVNGGTAAVISWSMGITTIAIMENVLDGKMDINNLDSEQSKAVIKDMFKKNFSIAKKDKKINLNKGNQIQENISYDNNLEIENIRQTIGDSLFNEVDNAKTMAENEFGNGFIFAMGDIKLKYCDEVHFNFNYDLYFQDSNQNEKRKTGLKTLLKMSEFLPVTTINVLSKEGQIKIEFGTDEKKKTSLNKENAKVNLNKKDGKQINNNLTQNTNGENLQTKNTDFDKKTFEEMFDEFFEPKENLTHYKGQEIETDNSNSSETINISEVINSLR